MKSKGKIKLSEKEGNQVESICELPVTVQHGKYLAKYREEKNLKNYIYLHYSYTSYKNQN